MKTFSDFNATEPFDELTWLETPTIYRWTSRIDDVVSAPRYVDKVEGNVKDVNYDLVI